MRIISVASRPSKPSGTWIKIQNNQLIWVMISTTTDYIKDEKTEVLNKKEIRFRGDCKPYHTASTSLPTLVILFLARLMMLRCLRPHKLAGNSVKQLLDKFTSLKNQFKEFKMWSLKINSRDPLLPKSTEIFIISCPLDFGTGSFMYCNGLFSKLK